MAKKFYYNSAPSLNYEHLSLLECLRELTIEVMRESYPNAYAYDKIREENKYTANDKRPQLRGKVTELLDNLEDIYSENVRTLLSSFEKKFRPIFEKLGFERVIEYILPIVMNSGLNGELKKDDLIRVELLGTVRCLDCFREAVKYGKDSSEVGFFKLPRNENTNIVTTTLDDIAENWQQLFPTDSRLSDDETLMQRYTPKYCLANKNPNPNHKDIVLLSTVISLEHVKRDSRHNEERVRGSNVLHMRDKAGYEMARKIMLYLIGKSDAVTDGIGSRSIVPDEVYAEVLVRTIRDYPFKNVLNGSLHATNYEEKDLSELLARGKKEKLGSSEVSYLSHCIDNMMVDNKDIIGKHKGEEQKVKEIEWMWFFGKRYNIVDNNVGKHMFYDATNYQLMNSTNGYDALDHQKKRESDAEKYYTVAHWNILSLLKSMIYFNEHVYYNKEIGKIRLLNAMAKETKNSSKRHNPSKI